MSYAPFNIKVIMDIIKKEIQAIISSVSNLLGKEISPDSYEIEILNPPHEPKTLPKHKMGVYMFKYKDDFLKIGKVGEKSNARFQSQHYNPNSSQSNLSKSLLKDFDFKDKERLNLDEENVGDWIKNNCQRINIIIKTNLNDDPDLNKAKTFDKFTLSLIESILHYKYLPKYEG